MTSLENYYIDDYISKPKDDTPESQERSKKFLFTARNIVERGKLRGHTNFGLSGGISEAAWQRLLDAQTKD
ncbi:MAG: hypothetical protein V3V47_00305 [Desulfobacteria bacterium]